MQGDGREIGLTVPGAEGYLRLVRMVAADLGERAGFDAEQVDELRIAMGELCHHLVDAGTDAVTLRFVVGDHRVAVRGVARRAVPQPGSARRSATLDGVSGVLLQGVADHHEIVEDDDIVTFALLKRASSGAPSGGAGRPV